MDNFKQQEENGALSFITSIIWSSAIERYFLTSCSGLNLNLISITTPPSSAGPTHALVGWEDLTT